MPGEYRVVFTLAKPGYALVPEDQPKSADHLTGTSHLKLPRRSLSPHLESGETIPFYQELDLIKQPCEFELDNRAL